MIDLITNLLMIYSQSQNFGTKALFVVVIFVPFLHTRLYPLSLLMLC